MDDLRNARHRHRAREDGVDKTEDDAVGAYARSEGERCDQREAGVAAERPEAVTQVLSHGFEPGQRAPVAALLLGPVQSAEREQRPAARLGWGHAGADVIPDAALHVEFQLVVEVALEPAPAEQIEP